ncbi:MULTISPECIES: PLP-dependent aminotransferase family protein [Staphylococcus]|uniref:HTH-type transcriptional regulator NorG n=1 Tax=Staphylococcus hsinchuensis TaxID=3051183 RepID=A0ABZ3EEU0_9STAP|nr:PLP-dependent aminotransferase family protein [Staphylococcus sp. Marseille-Q6910]
MTEFKYKKIVDDVIQQINDGLLKPGDKLQSQREIANQYHVNRSTVVQALDILKSYGILDSFEKRGIFVSENKWHVYMTSNIRWQDFIGNSISKNNHYYIQKINELEFDNNIIRVGTGELGPDMIPNDKFADIVKSAGTELSTNYEEPKGNLLLRQQIVKYMKRKNVECETDNICITSGALQALKLIADGLLVPQSKIIIETPSYINSVRTWHNIRANIIPFKIEDIKRNINNLFKVNSDYNNSIFYCIPTLHNPTQNTYTKSEKQKIIDQCNVRGIPIVEDDIYADLMFDSRETMPMKSLENSNNVLYLGSLSKTVSPGLRIGWIVADKKVIRHLSDLKMQNDYGASSISQYIAKEWLEKYHVNHIENLNKQLESKRDEFIRCLNKYLSSFGTWKVPEGSFYIWFELDSRVNVKQLFNHALNENILIQPGEIYDQEAANHIRFSYSYIKRDEIDSTLQKLSAIIERLI